VSSSAAAMRELLADLVAERDQLRLMLAGATEDMFNRMTPAAPWTIRDQISHLAFFDTEATKATRDADEFAEALAVMAEIGPEAYMQQHITRGRAMTAGELMTWLTDAETTMVAELSSRVPDDRLPWYGPPMRASSFVIARLMETWAHGQDIADALGIRREPTDRLFGVAELGIRTFSFSFRNRGLDVPDERVRVALRGSTGTVRVWNDEHDASVTGPLEDFCLVVTQRRHIDDTHLVLEGALAEQWMTIAQAFAGPPGPGRQPLG